MKKSLGPHAYALPTPVWVIGSYGVHEQPNIMVAAWGSICCTTPPCLSISIKKNRATFAGIVDHGAFTVSIPPREYLVEVDYIGMVSGVSNDKFSNAGLTAVRSKLVDAPYVEEFPLCLECKVLHQLDIGSHTQFIGQVLDIKADEAILDDLNIPIAARIDPLISSAGERAYYALGKHLEKARLPGAQLIKQHREEREQLLNF